MSTRRRRSATKDAAAEGAFVLVGRPHAMRGELRLVNSGDEDVVVAGLRARTEAVPSGTVDAAAAAVVPAQAARRVAVSATLDPSTPAGEYAGEVDVPGGVRRVVLVVTEVVDLDLAPARLYVSPAGTEPVAAALVAANRGNVAVRLPAAARTAVPDAGTLTLRLGSSPIVVQPGEVRTLSVEITPPEDADPAQRYDVGVALGPADLTVVLLPTADETVTPHSSAVPRRRWGEGP